MPQSHQARRVVVCCMVTIAPTATKRHYLRVECDGSGHCLAGHLGALTPFCFGGQVVVVGAGAVNVTWHGVGDAASSAVSVAPPVCPVPTCSCARVARPLTDEPVASGGEDGCAAAYCAAVNTTRISFFVVSNVPVRAPSEPVPRPGTSQSNA